MREDELMKQLVGVVAQSKDIFKAQQEVLITKFSSKSVLAWLLASEMQYFFIYKNLVKLVGKDDAEMIGEKLMHIIPEAVRAMESELDNSFWQMPGEDDTIH